LTAFPVCRFFTFDRRLGTDGHRQTLPSGELMGQEARMDQESFMRTGSNENRLPTAIPTRASMPLPRAPQNGQPNARVVPAAGNRRLSSFREVAGAVCRNGIYSKSIRAY
jgi:hypothetical protein